MSKLADTRLQVVFGDLREAVSDVIRKHEVTEEELLQAIAWVQQLSDAGELMLGGALLFMKPVLERSVGAAYAHPEKDGASQWDLEGPAYVPGAPVLKSPCVLPMRPDEQGDPLIVSGVVRSTSGEPLPGAIVDVWHPDQNATYSGLTPEDFAPLDYPNDATDIPPFNLRGKIVADDEGRYEFRTVVPGTEPLGLKEDTPLGGLTKALERAGARPSHIHSTVSADGFHPLTTQLYFDGDPLIEALLEGTIRRSQVKTTELHDAAADYTACGLDRPYRTVIYDYVLRPVTSAVTVPVSA